MRRACCHDMTRLGHFVIDANLIVTLFAIYCQLDSRYYTYIYVKPPKFVRVSIVLIKG